MAMLCVALYLPAILNPACVPENAKNGYFKIVPHVNTNNVWLRPWAITKNYFQLLCVLQ